MTNWMLVIARQRRNRARIDLLAVLVVTAASFVLAGAFEWQEKLAASAIRFEAWQLDEAPLMLTVLSLGLAWYAWRRRADTAQLLAHNRELAQRLIKVQENERLAIARELHDDLAQHCTAIRLEAAFIERSRDVAQIAASAQRTSAEAAALQHSVRRLLRRLRPAELDALGLVAALQSLCDDWHSRSGLRCSLVHRGASQNLGEALDTAVYRVVQEALSNVVRHARASGVRIELAADDETLTLCVQDDGQGFDATRTTRGLGLLGIAERASALGGRLLATSAPGAGARLSLTLPRKAAA
jgi:two-component system sensor histidine kinase UhpB